MIKEYYGSLHNHIDFSNFRLRDSINTIESLVDRAIELNQKCVAITDHETIASHIKAEEYYEKIKEKNPEFKLIRGNEIYLCRNGLNKHNYKKGEDKFYHFILLAKDAIGHKQIREISTRAWSHSFKTGKMIRVPTYYQDLFDILKENKGHIIGSTACLGGVIPTQLLKYKENPNEELYDKIINWCLQMEDLFGKGNFFLEMQPSNNEEQIYVNQQLIKISQNTNIPFIITTDSHYLKKEDRKIHKAFLNAQEGDREVDDFYSTTYLMDTKEIIEYMLKSISLENIYIAFQNIQKIYDMCIDYSLKKDMRIPYLSLQNEEIIIQENLYNKYKKHIPMLSNFYNSSYKSDKDLLWILLQSIDKDKYVQTPEAFKEINVCLNSVWISSDEKKRWSAYLLNVRNFVKIIWNVSLVGPSRGSGGGFILLYLLGITQINPMRENTKLFHWRFLNPARVSPLDIDIDIEANKRELVYKSFQDVYGKDRVSKVLTIRTEKPRSAILTAARGLGIDVDIAQSISSLVEKERGIDRTLSEMYYGDEEKGIKPSQAFISEMNRYPELWETAQRIENLICGYGSHAGGVFFVDEPFTETTALMKTANNDVITQFDLHDSEKVSLIKIDLLSIEALDRIRVCLDLLVEYNIIKKGTDLRETYENTIGIYNLERDDPKMWEMCWNHEVMNLFQMEQQSGIQGIALTKPTSVDDLATINSVMRLMSTEKGAEQPLEKYARFKSNINYWYQEMKEYGLTEDEMELLKPVLNVSYGICNTQEQFMQLVQIPECGGFDLVWSDKLRKSIAKKNPKEYEKLTTEYFSIIKEKKLSYNLCNYVWNVLIATSRG